MRRLLLPIACCLLPIVFQAQAIKEKLQKAYQQFESDSQLRHASSSLYVINAKTGEIVFDKNSQLGLAPASTQKIITAATAFELLGKDYRYKTDFQVYISKEKIYDIEYQVALYVKPSGDPTFGSWRWEYHNDKNIIKRLVDSVKKAGVTLNTFIFNEKAWNSEDIPDGWIWQDIGNYYGAGATGINWRENQFEVILKSGRQIGDKVEIVRTNPVMSNYKLFSLVTSAAKGTGDNAYVYFPLTGEFGTIRGTIPVNENNFSISAAMPSGRFQFMETIFDTLKIDFKKSIYSSPGFDKNDYRMPAKFSYSEFSPSLDSIIYWFLQKSINLYGEALVKTFAYEKKGFGSTDTGVNIVKDFWKQKGLDPEELNMYDGSGLSPLNRVTTHAQVEILKFAKKQSWFPYFYDALPEYNKMKMKSGTISDVKGFCGYQTSSDETEYIFSFLINNYSGSSSALVNKMYKVLDVLK